MGFLSQLHKIKNIKSNLTFLCDFEKKCKFWGEHFEKSTKNKIYWQVRSKTTKFTKKIKSMKNSQNVSVLQVFIKLPAFLTILGPILIFDQNLSISTILIS